MELLVVQVFTGLLLFPTATGEECGTGTIRMTNATVISTGEVYYLSGGLQLCWNSQWATVCHGRWNQPDAEVACRQLGLDYNSYCNNSCFGNIKRSPSFYRYNCTGNEFSLMNCYRETKDECEQGAGMVCVFNKTKHLTNSAVSLVTTTIQVSYETTSEVHMEERVCIEDNGRKKSELALGLLVALFSVLLLIAVACLILMCFKLHKMNSNAKTDSGTVAVSNTIPAQHDYNRSVHNKVYDMVEAPNNVPDTTPDLSSREENILSSARLTSQVITSQKCAENYNDISSDGHVYPHLFEDSFSDNENPTSVNTNEKESSRALSTDSDPVYYVLNSDEDLQSYQMI